MPQDAPQTPAERHYLEGTVDRFEEKFAIIVTTDKNKNKQELRWPVAKLPDDVEQGSSVRIVLSTAGSDQAERDQLAKTILNQILKQQDPQ